MKSGTAFCGLHDENISSYSACHVCIIETGCKECLNYANDVLLQVDSRELLWINCWETDSSYESCPWYCNGTQERLDWNRHHSWTDKIGRGCQFYEQNPYVCGVFDHDDENSLNWPNGIQSSFDGCPFACNESAILGNSQWRLNVGSDLDGASCLIFDNSDFLA